MEKRFVICSAMAIFASVAIASGVLRTNTSTPAGIGVPEAAFAVGDEFTVTPFSGVSFALKIVSAPPAGIAGQSFIARDVNGSASAVVKATKTGWRITIDDFENRRQYSLRCKDGVVTVTETDTTPEGPDECGTCGGQIEAPAVEATSATKLKATTPKLLSTTTDENAFEIAEHKSVVDILVAFDKGAKVWAENGSNWGNGGDSIEEFADYAVNKMNMVLEKSQLLDTFSYRLAGVTEVDDTYTSIGNQLLGNLRARVGALSKLTQLREKYGADTITLLIDKTEGNVTGIGYGYYPISSFPGPASFDGMNYACNVCDIKTVYSRYTMSHETGHNMGCDHSTRQGPDNSGPGRFEDSSGYHFVDANGIRRYTIMGYNYTADDDYYDYLPVPYFSSPDIIPDEYGCAVGVAGVNNNRRALTLTHGDIAGLREHVKPYEWDVRFLDDNGNDIADGLYFPSSCNVTLTNSNPNAEIYYTQDGATPTSASSHCNPGDTITVYLYSPKTITACAVTNGVAMSTRSITLRGGLTWNGDGNGAGVWASNDISAKPWSGEYFGGDPVVFPDLAGISCATVTVQDAVSPESVWFRACDTGYVFDKGTDAAQINLPDAAFVPAGDVTFNVPVKLNAVAFTNLNGRAITFNAPFGQNVSPTSGYCTNLVTIMPYATLTVAPGAGKTQEFDTLNNISFSSNATFRVGTGTVVFKGAINSGAGVIGRTKLEVGNGGELVFNMGGGTGHQMNQTSLTVEKGGVVRYNDMEHLCRTLFLSGGTIYAKRFDLMSNPGVYVADDSAIENNGGGYILIRDSDSEINVSDGKALTLNVGTQTDGRNDTSGWGIIKRGGGTLVANVELTHSGVTDIEEGTLEVGYSSGSTVYGQGWIVASNSTLRIKSGCTLKVPLLTLDPTSTISLPAVSSAPLIVNGNVDLTEVKLAIQEGGDLSLGASYPLVSSIGEISGLKDFIREDWPRPADGLGWKVAVSGGVLTASIVDIADADPYVDFMTNISGLRPTIPEDATMSSAGGLQIGSSPIVIDGLATNAVGVTLDVTIGEPAAAERTICAWVVNGNLVRCVVTNGVLDCFWDNNSHVDNSASFLTLSPGRHVINVGYKSLDDNTYGGTFVYVDGTLAYRASGLRWSGKSVTKFTVGATAKDTPDKPYTGLVVHNFALLNESSTSPLPNMTSSGGTVTYDYFAGKPPCVFALTPDGAFETYGAILSGAFSGTYNALSVSVVASFPENATGTIVSSAVLDGYYAYSTQVEYRGNGVLAFRDNGSGSLIASVQVSADMSARHLYTLTYTNGTGYKLYLDGTEVLSNISYYNGNNMPIINRVVFGCGYWTNWMTSYNDNPNPISNLKVYASHIALGTDDRTVSEAAVKEATGYEPEEPEDHEEPETPDPEPPTTPAVVDVLVAYDNGAYNYVTSRSRTLEEFAETQIERMNDVLVTNKLDRFYSYRLAGVCRVNEGYSDINNVATLVAEGEGPCASLRAAREMCGADTVTLLVNTSGSTLGNSLQIDYRDDVPGQHDCAYSVCAISAVDSNSQYTMIHENAHTMGCGHARAQYTAEDLALDPDKYSYGYYFTDENSVNRHTIMAYGNNASPYFSTTSSEFGYNLGNRTNNNARVLKETCADVSRWRDNVMPFDNEAIVTVDGTGEEVVSGRMFANQISIRLASQIEGAEIYYSLNGIDPTYEEVENVDESEYVYPYTSDYPVINIKADKTLSVALKPAGADYILPVRRVKFIRCDLLANASDAAWQTSLKFPWTTEDETIRSCNHTDYSSKNKKCTTPLKATIVGPKRLSFSHKSYFGGTDVTDSNYSHFDVLLDDSPVLAQTECNNNWSEAYVDVPEGTHEVTFVFSQRYAMNNTEGDNKGGTPKADDAVWLKDIVLADPVKPAESDVADVIFSNTNASPDQASWTISGNPTLTIPAKSADGIINGTLIKIQSLDFGYAGEDNKDGAHAKKIAITDGTTTWTSASVVTNTTDTFPYKNNTAHDRLVYSFVDANCILAVGTDYTLKLLDASGDEMSSIRYVLVSGGASIISGMDFTSSNTTYTPMMQLKGEVAKTSCFDWTPGGAPTGWFTLWGGENLGGTHEKIGPDGLTTNLYVTFHESNDDEDKWHPWNGNAAAMGDYTFLVYGNIDEVKPASGKLGVLWDMGFSGNQKTVLVKDSAGNVKLVQANGNTITRCINAGPVEGYHLFTVRFSEANGASLQIDDGMVYPDCTFTQISGTGLQVGSILGGLPGAFARGDGFAVLKMMAFDTDSIPAWQYKLLCEEYPAVINHVLITVDNVEYYRLKYAIQDLKENDLFSVTDDVVIDFDARTISSPISGETYTFAELGQGLTLSDNGDGTYSLVSDIAETPVLRISEIMPKPTDDRNPGQREGMDVNGLESGWVEVENTSDKWADLNDYRFIRVNRGKKTDPAGVGNFPSRLVPPRGRAIFYTSERYSNSKDKTVSAFAEGTFDGKPMIFEDYGNILVWGDKVNPKKSPYVRLYYAPGGDSDNGTVVDTVVVPSDLPEGWSIIVGNAEEGEGTRRWMCPTPTRGTANTKTDGLTRIGPNVGPLYEKKGQKKTDHANEFAVPVPPAVPGTDYTVTLPINAVMNPDGTFTPRAADQIQSLKFVYRKDLDDTTLVTNVVEMATKNTVENWGDQYTATIPSDYFPDAGHLMQWKVLITDGEGVEWTSPSFNNKDDGYEWYGTIVEPGELNSATLPTWHMFASGSHLTQMDYDKDDSRYTLENGARIAIYDSSTSNYYDYVRIDLRGNTSAGFTKKGHGLRFAKAHPLTMVDSVTGETIEEIRKTSLISEFADPSFMRQMIAFWLWRKMGNLVPFDFPVRCNLNGEFYQLAFNSERFTDELIEDVYGLDKFGYGYKNVGTLKSGSGTTAGGIEKKTPDDEDESNITVLQNELRSKITAAQNVSGTSSAALSSSATDTTGLDNAALTKFVVQKFDLPAWLNYLASAKITQEMDDVWANICAYYDNPDMLEGTRGKGTWMPLGYDFNISFGQYYQGDIGSKIGLMSDQDWFKSHPFYGGNRVRCWKQSGMTETCNNGNDGFEAVWQSAKFRRLYLRRLRTLMDQELKEPGTPESEVPFMVKMREMANLMRADSALDLVRWPDDTTDNAIDVWPSEKRPEDMDAGIDEIWNDYVVPRQQHLFVTHSVTNTAKAIGYGSNLNAGIPEAQSPIATLAPNIYVSNLTALDAEQAEALGVTGQLYDTEVVVIRNDNAEAVDMSGWRLAFSVDFTFPAGTVCDANDSIYIVADRRAYIDAHEAELTDQVIVGNATFTGAGPIALYDADGTLVYSAIPQTDELKYLRLHSFYGNTLGGGDTGEWFTLTNISDSVTLDLADVTVCFLKQGDDHDTTDHCHVTLTNKKGKGDVNPLKSWTAQQADYSDKGWLKIQNNKQQITIYDKYGSVCQSLKVTQKTFPLACGNGGYLVCDSVAASVIKDSDWHEALYELANDGASSENFSAEDQAAANELVANAKPVLSDDDIVAGLDAQYLTIVAEPVEDEEGKYKAVVAVDPETVSAPVIAEPTTEVDPVEVEEVNDGETTVSVSISNAVKGLWYGYEVSDELGESAVFDNDVDSFKRATGSAHTITGSPRTEPSGFFRVKVLPAKPKP